MPEDICKKAFKISEKKALQCKGQIYLTHYWSTGKIKWIEKNDPLLYFGESEYIQLK